MKTVFWIKHEIAKRNPWISFKKELFLRCTPTSWMEKRIEKDLSLHKKISKTHLQTTLFSTPQSASLYLFVIQKNRLLKPSLAESLFHPRLRKMVFFFQKLLKIIDFPDVTFLFSLHDLYENPQWLHTAQAPVFAISKTEDNPHVCLFPHVEWLNLWQFIQKKIHRSFIPWEKREPKLFWRGATTGEEGGLRWKLHEWGKTHPQHLDSGFCSLAQGHQLEIKKPLLPEEQIRYKYLLALDGNCFPGSFFWQLSSESLVFKQDSPYLEWYYEGLKPYEHYIPLARDGSDLFHKKQWAKQHDLESRKVAQNAKIFANQNLSVESIVYYIVELFKRYSLLFNSC